MRATAHSGFTPSFPDPRLLLHSRSGGRRAAPAKTMAHALPKTGGAPNPTRSGDSDRAPEGPDPLIGSLIADKFEITALMGEGAMGRIYRARHLALDRM